MKLNISNLRKLEEVFLSDRSDSPRNSQYSQSYHNYESSVNCPRCQNLGELIEDGPIRSLYRCRDCGIFAKLTKKQRLHGLRQSITCQELTTALEILEVAGHKDQDAIDALNLYRGVVSHA